MLKSHEKFHSSNGKRLILVADDERINREILGVILNKEYEVIYAADGMEAIDQVQRWKDELSLVLLDLMMPFKSGKEVLQEMKDSPELEHIPVIVLTADQNAEIECLNVGAIDYIPKPYPQSGIILARILRAIELSEDREIIQSTERDPLTGLYNRDYFYRYAEQFDQHHKDLKMDAIVVDINHFHMINERFGNDYGDEVLCSIGERIREIVSGSGGIVCRREADTFLVYCPHGLDYKAILEKASIVLSTTESVNNRVRLRMGVYAKADKTMKIERRFDRAKLAADTVRNSFTKTVGIYDDTMHERELYAEHLIDDFHRAIEEKQFVIYYQPKFDIRPKEPFLTSAEALVRWQHPELGMISPGVFIPLFENNGLIQELDRYVWKEAAAQIREWKTRFGFSLPVSVNVSRIDMYDPDLLGRFERILNENHLLPSELLLEITESAYTQDSEQIIETVNNLREMGFRVEMDDFGTGYSSLNMISSLPIDALKLDMKFVHSAFKDQKNTHMLEVIIEIADYLSVPVIAEGVETEEQLAVLRKLGCDIVQGYYFSKPVPAADFVPFLEARKALRPMDLLPEDYTSSREVADRTARSGEGRNIGGIPLRLIIRAFTTLSIVIVLILAVSSSMLNRGYERLVDADARYLSVVQTATNLNAGSDYLSASVRSFVQTGNLQYLQDYFEEANVTRRRDNALSDLENLLGGNDSAVYAHLRSALDLSNELMEREYHAMRLTQAAYGYADSQVPEEVSSVPLSAEELSLPPEELKNRAEHLVFDEAYMSCKDQIHGHVVACTDQFIENADQATRAARINMNRILTAQSFLLVALLAAALAEVIFLTRQLRIPLTRMVDLMRNQEKVPPSGAAELRFVTQTYNEILEANRRSHRKLTYEVSHDPLTGLLNRSAYEMFMETADREHIALLIIDVDKFKDINDTYGHDIGDRILKRVSEILTQSFRSVDAVCRLGGDEFVVVMTRADSSMHQLVINKINQANNLLQNPKDGLPKASLSVGVAFADRKNPEGDIFKDADTALYRVKQGGRCGCAIFGADDGDASAGPAV